MKIKIQLNNREKTLMFATSWSLFLVSALLVFVGFMIYKMTPQDVFLRVPASQLQEGSHQITVRAVNLANVSEVLYVGTAEADVRDGSLVSEWTPPKHLHDKAYVIEVCTDSVGGASESCFRNSRVQGASTDQEEKPVNSPLVSCPYYVGKNKPSFFANLFGTNDVNLSSRVYCPSDVTGGGDFATYSRIDAIVAANNSGITTQGGILVSRGGEVETLSYEQVLGELTEKLPTAEDVAKQLFLSATVTPPADSDAQALTLSGNELSISGGNVITLPAEEHDTASASTDGLLSSSDWSLFAAKENSLTFDASFLRTGDSLALMSCAAGEIMKNDGSAWLCANDIGAGSGTYGAGTGISIDVFNDINNTGLLSLTAGGALASSGGQTPAISLTTTSDFNQLSNQLSLSTTGVVAGSYNNVTVDAQGRVTNGANVTYLTAEGDGAVGNEVAGIVSGGGLVMTGSGTSVSPYRVGLITTCSAGQVMKWNGAAWACAADVDTDTNTDAQTLTFNPATSQLGVSGGNAVDLSALKDNTDSQTLSIAGNVISLTNGGSVALPADQNTTYTSGSGLVLAGTVFAVNAPTCIGTQKLSWNGTAFVCGADVDTDTNTDAQTLAWNSGTRTLSIAGGNAIVIPDTNTDAQSLSYNSATGAVSISGGTGFTLPLANTSTQGLLSSTDWNAFSGKENVLSFSNGLLRTANSVELMSCATNKILKNNGGAWLCADDIDTDTNTTYSSGSGLSLTGTTFALAGTSVLAGTYNSLTVDTLGRVTAGTTVSYLTGENDGTVGNEITDVSGSGLIRTGNGTAGDPYRVGLTTSCGSNQILKYVASAWTCANDIDTDTDTNTDAQQLSFNTTTNQLSIGGGNTVDLSQLAIDTDTDTDDQSLSLTSNTLSLSDGGSVDLAAYLDNTDAQALSWNAGSRTLSLSGGGQVVISDADTDTDTTYSAGNGISLAGTTFSVNSPTCGAGEFIAWNGTSFSCAVPAGSGVDTTNFDIAANGGVAENISAGETVNFVDGTGVNASRSGNDVSFSLADTGTAGTYGSSTSIPVITVDAQGRVTGTSEQAIPTSSASTTGLLGATDFASFLAKEDALTFTGNGLFTRTGDTITGVTCGVGQVLKYSGSWQCQADIDTDTDTDAQTLSYNSSTRELSLTGGNVVTFPLSTSSVTGVLSSADWAVFNGKENALTFSDGLSRSGDEVSLMDCAGSQIVQRNSGDTAWVCADQVVDTDTDTDTNTTYSAGTGLTLVGTTFALEGTSITAGTYNNVTVDTLGRVTGTSNVSYLTSEGDGSVGNELVDVSGTGLVRTGAGTVGDPYKVGLVTSCGDGQLLKYTTAGGWACASDIDTDTDTNTDQQTLAFNTTTNILTVSGGNTVDLSTLKDDTDTDTDTQDLSWNNSTRTLSLVDGGSVVISDANTTYDAGQGLDLAGTTFSLAQQGAGNGQVLKWNGSSWAPADDSDTDTTYTAGTGISISSGQISTNLGIAIDSGEIVDGTIAAADIAASGATAGTYADSGVTVAQISVNEQGQVTSIGNRTLPTANTTTTGVLSSTDWNTFNGKENILTFSDGVARSGNTVTLMDCAASQIIQRNGGDSAWVCANQVVDTDTDTNTTYSAGTGLTLAGTTFELEGTSVIAGTYNNVTVDTLGRVTGGTNVSYLTAEVDGVIGNEVAGVVNSGGLVMTGAGTGGDPYRLGLITTCADGQLLKYTNGGGWACANDTDTDTDTDDQSLSYNTGTGILTIADGNTVDLSTLKDNTDTQDLSWNNGTRTLSLVDGGSVVISDSDTTYAAGNGLSLAANEFAIDSPTCASTDKLQWSGTAFVCAADVDTDTNTTYSSGTGISFAGTVISSTLGVAVDSAEITDGTITSDDLDETGAVAGTYGDSGVSVAQLSVNAQGQVTSVSSRALPTAATSTTGVLSSTDWNTFNGKENVLTFNDGLSRSGNTVSLMDCAASQIVQRNGGDTAWVCANQVVDTDTNTTYSAGTGITLTGTTFSLTGTSITPDTYNSLTVDALGRVTGGTNIAYLTAENDGVVGNEVANVVNNGGLVMTGSGTGGSPYVLGLITTCGDNQLLKYTSGGGWACASDVDTDTNTDQQNLSYNTGTNILTIAGGNTVDLTELQDNTDTQDLAWDNGTRTLSLTDGGNVVISDTDTAYSAALNGGLALNSTAFSLRSCSTNQILKATAVAGEWGCATDVDTDTNTTYSEGTGISFAGTVISSTLGVAIDTGEITDNTIAAADLATSGASAGTYGDSGVSVAQLTVNSKGQVTSVSSRALPTATTGVTGVLSSTDWNTFNGKENVLSFNGPLSRVGSAVSLAACTGTQIYQYNGSAWACANQVVDTDTNTTYSAGSGLTMTGTTLSLNCSTTANTAFCNGGNSYGGVATLGTDDEFGLNIATDDAVAASFSATGELLLKDPSNNAISFQVQNSTALPHFTVDTVNSQLLVGSSTTDENAIELVLDSYNNATDPAGTNGAMYYNSAVSKFRCYEGSAWKDCVAAGYTLSVQALTSSPTDSQTVYFGNMPKAPVTTAGTSKIYIPKTGTIKHAEIYSYAGTAGSNQAWSLYIRKNNTTDTLIETVSLATNERVFNNAGLSIAVTAGDYIEIKGIQPAWGTNPLTLIYGGYVYIE